MATLNVQFIGSCTHVRVPGTTQIDDRVVLINWRDGGTINGNYIEPHIARLYFNGDQVVSMPSLPCLAPATGPLPPELPPGVTGYDLNGVQLTVNEAQGKFSRGPHFVCVPKLHRTGRGQMPPLSNPTVVGEDASLASAYFDINNGTIIGFQQMESVAVQLTVSTPGNTATVRMRCFGDTTTSDLVLADNATIYVTNLDTFGDTGSDEDMLISYKIFTSVPADAHVADKFPSQCMQTQAKETAARPVKPIPLNVGMGCSNTDFP